MKHEFEKYCKDYENIENYQKAKKDDFKGWHCHHRLETHNSDGERRLVDISYKELKALGMYYNRPAEELIFLTESEHNAYNKGKSKSAETRRKMSEARKGENHYMYGKHHSEETRKRMSEAAKGKPKSEEARKRMSEAKKGKPKSEEHKNKLSKALKVLRWYNNGKINIRAKGCPEGFVPGRLRK